MTAIPLSGGFFPVLVPVPSGQFLDELRRFILRDETQNVCPGRRKNAFFDMPSSSLSRFAELFFHQFWDNLPLDRRHSSKNED